MITIFPRRPCTLMLNEDRRLTRSSVVYGNFYFLVHAVKQYPIAAVSETSNTRIRILFMAIFCRVGFCFFETI